MLILNQGYSFMNGILVSLFTVIIIMGLLPRAMTLMRMINTRSRALILTAAIYITDMMTLDSHPPAEPQFEIVWLQYLRRRTQIFVSTALPGIEILFHGQLSTESHDYVPVLGGGVQEEFVHANSSASTSLATPSLPFSEDAPRKAPTQVNPPTMPVIVGQVERSIPGDTSSSSSNPEASSPPAQTSLNIPSQPLPPSVVHVADNVEQDVSGITGPELGDPTPSTTDKGVQTDDPEASSAINVHAHPPTSSSAEEVVDMTRALYTGESMYTNADLPLDVALSSIMNAESPAPSTYIDVSTPSHTPLQLVNFAFFKDSGASSSDQGMPQTPLNGASSAVNANAHWSTSNSVEGVSAQSPNRATLLPPVNSALFNNFDVSSSHPLPETSGSAVSTQSRHGEILLLLANSALFNDFEASSSRSLLETSSSDVSTQSHNPDSAIINNFKASSSCPLPETLTSGTGSMTLNGSEVLTIQAGAHPSTSSNLGLMETNHVSSPGPSTNIGAGVNASTIASAGTNVSINVSAGPSTSTNVGVDDSRPMFQIILDEQIQVGSSKIILSGKGKGQHSVVQRRNPAAEWDTLSITLVSGNNSEDAGKGYDFLDSMLQDMKATNQLHWPEEMSITIPSTSIPNPNNSNSSSFVYSPYLRKFYWKGNLDAFPNPWLSVSALPFQQLSNLTLNNCELSCRDCLWILSKCDYLETFKVSSLTDIESKLDVPVPNAVWGVTLTSMDITSSVDITPLLQRMPTQNVMKNVTLDLSFRPDTIAAKVPILITALPASGSLHIKNYLPADMLQSFVRYSRRERQTFLYKDSVLHDELDGLELF